MPTERKHMEIHMQVAYNMNKKQEAIAEYTTKVTNDCQIIESGNMSITLFVPQFNQDPDKGSELIYNASVRVKFGEEGSISFKAPVTRIKKSGNIIVGNASKLWGHQAVLTSYSKKNKANYEDMAISNNLYSKMIALIATTLVDPDEETPQLDVDGTPL